MLASFDFYKTVQSKPFSALSSLSGLSNNALIIVVGIDFYICKNNLVLKPVDFIAQYARLKLCI